jgi:hypothetical protein
VKKISGCTEGKTPLKSLSVAFPDSDKREQKEKKARKKGEK